MDSHSSEVARRVVDAALRGDVAVLHECVSPDAVWHVPGTNPLAGDYAGPGGVARYNAELARWSDPSACSIEDVVVNLDEDGDCYVVVLERRTIKLDSGDTWATEGGEVIRVHGDQVTEAWLFHQDQEEVDRLLREAAPAEASTAEPPVHPGEGP